MRHFAHNIGDYAAATAHLSFIEDAAYHRCLRRYYQDERALPADMTAVCRLVGARTKEERAAVGNVIAEFFVLQDDGWHQRRADREIEVYHSKAKDGAKGAVSRWGTPKEMAAQNRSQRLSAARAKATHTKDEWAVVLEVFDSRCVKCGTPASELIGGTICKDHVVGIRNGGDDGVWNLQPMCRPCNTAKGQDGDYRGNVLPDWKERLAKRLAECLATTPHSPLPKEDKTPNGVLGAKAPKATRKTKLPADWQPSEEQIAYAREQGCADPADTAERFRLHHQSKGTLGVDWNLGFQYWCRNEKNYRRATPEDRGDKRAREIQQAIEASREPMQ